MISLINASSKGCISCGVLPVPQGLAPFRRDRELGRDYWSATPAALGAHPCVEEEH
jgi:hypothetical protein